MARANKAFSELSSAVDQQDLATVTKLAAKVKADAQPYNADGDSLLMAAINNDAPLPLIRALVEQGGASYDYTNSEGATPIACAETRDRRDLIEYFASRGAKVRYVPFAELPQETKNQRLAAAIADWTDSKLAERIVPMLAGGADPNRALIDLGSRKTPVLHFLAFHGAELPEVIAKLLAAGGDPTLLDDEGLAPIHVLSDNASAVEVAELYLAQVPIDLRDRAGATPLHHAAAAGYWDAKEFVKLLIDKGADLSARDRANKRPVDLALGDSKKVLIAAMTPPLAKPTLALLTAISANDLAKATAALHDGADPCAVDPSDKGWGPRRSADGISALHAVFLRGVDRAIAEAVLAHPKVDVNVRATDGRTPLHILLQFGQGDARVELTDRLIAMGADVSAADDFCRTPIYQLMSFYAYDRELDLYDRLLAAGANTAHVDRAEDTILDQLWESTQRFSEVNDKPGFVRLMTRLVADKVPTKAGKYLTKWLETKGAKYADKPAKPATKPKPTKARVAFDKLTGGKLAKLTGEDAYLPLAGEKRAVALFDWFVLLDEEAADSHEWVSQIWSYHITGKAIAHVKAERWIPFGIVNMTGTIESFEEIGVDGTLYVELDKAKGNDAPVVFAAQEHMGLRPQHPIEVESTTYNALMAKLKRK